MKHNRTNNTNLTSKSKHTSCQVASASQHRSNMTKHSHKWLLATQVHSRACIADRRDSRQKPVLSHLHPRSDPDASLMRSRAASPTWGSNAHGGPLHTVPRAAEKELHALRASVTEGHSGHNAETQIQFFLSSCMIQCQSTLVTG